VTRSSARGADFDRPDTASEEHRWHASPQARFERLLLHGDRLYLGPENQRLPAILDACQNEVSIRLAGQVLRALNELVRGFQEADRAARGKILGDALQHDPNHIYGGMLTTLMRMVPPDPGRAHFSTLNPGRFLPETGRRAFFTQAHLKDTKSGKRASRADRGSRPTSATSADGS
jgi:hypothetical protein